MTKVRTVTLLVLLASAPGALVAQEPRVPTSLAQCAAIESAVARLDCFDALARSQRAADAPEPQERSAPTQASESAVVPEAPEPDAARPSRRDERVAAREQRDVTSRVAALREVQPGRLEVTLANGQIWRQTNSDRYNLLVGHEVVVYPTGFGQYFRLSSKQARGFIQVERVR